MAQLTLTTEIQYLKGVGPKPATLFNKLGVRTVGDLLFYLPKRYEDRRNLPPINKLRSGQASTVIGRVISFDARPTGRGMVVMRAVVHDRTGSVALVWFNQPWVRRQLEEYTGEIIAFGMVRDGRNGLEMHAPEWEILDEESEPDDFARIVPVYGLTEGLSQKKVRNAVTHALEATVEDLVDALPPAISSKHQLGTLAESVRAVHRPESIEASTRGRHRLVFEEFFYLQLALAMNRADTASELGVSFPIKALLAGGTLAGHNALPEGAGQVAAASGKNAAKPRGAVVKVAEHPTTLFASEAKEKRDGVPLWDQIHTMLPFALTSAQRRVIQEVWADMERPHPMNRLVQGDVGSGKTAVAACAMLAAVRSGYQAALMAPTEILAEQHAINLRRLFEPLGIDVVLMVGRLNVKERKLAREKVASGAAEVVVGTQALIEADVTVRNLGLVVVDEQHRFGVLQRAALRDKGVSAPDVLVMTATPIPRTLTMTVFGDLDVSVIDELPPGRKPIKTHHRYQADREATYSAVRKLISEGRQAYFVCPLVSESELMLAQAAEELYLKLKDHVFPDYRVALLHGKLKPKDKESVMLLFRNHEIDVLVSTTVIEVGVDVPNATVMVIEDANRFGLAQLHQLRGRVGRGGHQSFCILVADVASEDSRARMEVMVDTTDGFRIAEEDLRLRGPGDLVGTRQSGPTDFRFGNLLNDQRLMEEARQEAIATISVDPRLSKPGWERVQQRVKDRRSKLAMVAIS